MPIYSVFVGPNFFKSFDKQDDADFLKESLDIFFQMEHLPYEATIKCEVM